MHKRFISKKFLIIFFLIFSIFNFFNFFDEVLSQAQECRLISAFWNKTTAVTGEEVTMTSRGSNCRGWSVSLNIYEWDPVRNDFIRTITAQFPNGQVSTSYRFTQEDYIKGGNESGSESMFFEAIAGSGATESKVRSGYLTLRRSIGTGSGGGPGSGGSGGQPGQPVSVSFNIPNPIQAESLVDLAKAIGRFLFQIAIPIAVIVIIYAGILFLTSGGSKEKITKARQALWYAVIGLAIILIGQGFFTLIKSILNLGG